MLETVIVRILFGLMGLMGLWALWDFIMWLRYGDKEEDEPTIHPREHFPGKHEK